MDATHLNCPACRTIRPIRFEPLLRGEPSLGTCVGCAHCRRHAFTLLRPARFYCEICDDVRPGLLERVEAERAEGLAVLLVCGGCFDAKAVLYASAARPGRYAGAAASDPPPRELPSDRARRG
jgi:hypothetical protein